MVFSGYSRVLALVFVFAIAALTIMPQQAAFAQETVSDEIVQANREAAQQALAKGEKEEALELISQVVIARPTDLSARFFRAQVLVALGRGLEIRDELELMASLNLPAEDKKRALELVKVIDKQASRLSGKASIKLAIGHTDNANSWPENGQFTGESGVVTPLTDMYDKFDAISDEFVEGSVSVFGDYKLTEAGDWKAPFRFTASNKEASDTVNLDSKYFSAKGGVEKSFDTGTTIKTNIGKTIIDRVNDYEGNTVNTDLDVLNYDLEISQKYGQYQTAIKYASSESDASKTSSADLYDATTNTTTLSLSRPMGSTMFVRGSIAAAQTRNDSDELASKKKTDRDDTTLSLLLVKVLPNSQRVIAAASFINKEYTEYLVNDAPNTKREDDTFALNIGYTIAGDQVLSYLEGYELGANFTYSKTDSNQESALVESKTVSFSISRKFDLF